MRRRWYGVAAVQVAVILCVSIWLALAWAPAPHSDWLYYWTAAGDPAAYQRGGIGLWLLAIPKALGLSPVVSALAVNVPVAIGLVCLAYGCDPTRYKVFAQLVVAYLFLITPFFGIVQLDMMAALCVAAFFWLALDHRVGIGEAWKLSFMVALLVVGVSTKPQYALVLWGMSALLLLASLVMRSPFRDTGAVRLAIVMIVASGLGFVVDLGMRNVSRQLESMRNSSAVTLYGGLLVSGTNRDCGYWSVAAAEAAKADMNRPLASAVVDRLSAKPLAHWAAVVSCKTPQILMPPPYALYWLFESPNIRAYLDAHPERQRIDENYRRALRIERKLYRILGALILLATFVAIWKRLANVRIVALLPTLWVLSFWCVHAVFEIQGRYFLGMFLVAPMLCAMAFSRGREWSPSDRPGTEPMDQVLR